MSVINAIRIILIENTRNYASSQGVGTQTKDGIFVALLGLMLVLLVSCFMYFGYGRDQAIFTLAARIMGEGGFPYKDAWDFKTPGIFIVYWLRHLLLGSSEISLRIFELGNLLLMSIAVFVLSYRVYKSLWPSTVSVFLIVFNYTVVGFWHVAQPESFSATLIVWALVLGCSSSVVLPIKDGLMFSVTCIGIAALYSFCALLKPPLGGGIVVTYLFILSIQFSYKTGSSGFYRLVALQTISFIIGFAIPIILVFGYLYWGNAIGSFKELIIEYLPNYTAISASEHGMAYLILKAVYVWLFSQFSWINLAGLMLFMTLPKWGSLERQYLFHLLGVIAICLVGVAIQAKFFAYHFGAVVSIASILAGWGIWKLWVVVRNDKRKTIFFSAAFLVLLILPYASFLRVNNLINLATSAISMESSEFNEVLYNVHSTIDMNAKSNHLVSDWIRQHTSAEDSIFVWGFEPSIYLYSDRKTSGRYIYNIAQRTSWSSDAAQRELIEDLEHARPRVIVVEEGDAMPQVTGNDRDSRDELEHAHQFNRFLMSNYVPTKRIGNLEIYTRID